MKKLIYFLIIVTFFSCENMETVVDLDVPPHSPVLVVNGILDTDTNTKIFVSHSVDAFSNLNPSFISDASVKLYKNNDNVPVAILTPDTSELIYVYTERGDSLAAYCYKSQYVPQKNSFYRIVVEHSNYKSVVAETYIPDDILLYDISIDSESNDDRIKLRFSYDDVIEQQNYYRLQLYSTCSKEWEDYVYEFNDWVEFLSNDPSFPQDDIPWDGYTYFGQDVVFTDALFDGQTKTIELDVETEYDWGDCDTVIVRFSNFSDDTYRYYRSLEDHVEKGEVDIFGGEVIPVYSNVTNGLGVLISVNAQNVYLKP